jgi:hypothetical protein
VLLSPLAAFSPPLEHDASISATTDATEAVARTFPRNKRLMSEAPLIGEIALATHRRECWLKYGLSATTGIRLPQTAQRTPVATSQPGVVTTQQLRQAVHA